MSDPRVAQVAELLVREAELVDKRQWDEWLDLMTEDIEYWIPAWDSETEYTSDPNSELSLIYYNSRLGLEDRVYRLRTGRSAASTPLARTCHMVSNVRARFRPDGWSEVEANWQVLAYNYEQTTTYFGYYEYLLKPVADGWKINKKKIIVLNPVIHTVLDVNLV